MRLHGLKFEWATSCSDAAACRTCITETAEDTSPGRQGSRSDSSSGSISNGHNEHVTCYHNNSNSGDHDNNENWNDNKNEKDNCEPL